jgi:hypothetical protein
MPWHGMVVGRAGRRHEALREVQHRRLLLPLRGETRSVCEEIFLSRCALVRGDSGRQEHRGDHQHHAELGAPRDHRRRGQGRQAHLPRQADRQQHRRRARADRGLPQGQSGARARLPAQAREPFPLDQGQPGQVRQAGQRRGQHQPRPAGQDRPELVALYRRGHARRRDAADRHPLHRCPRISARSGQGGERAFRAPGAARRQPGRGEPGARARERRALHAERELRIGFRVLPDEHLRQGSERLLRPAPGTQVFIPGRIFFKSCALREKRSYRRGAGRVRRGGRGDGEPEMDGERSTRSLAVLLAGIQSAREARRVEIREILK